jgi:hypothetical protein
MDGYQLTVQMRRVMYKKGNIAVVARAYKSIRTSCMNLIEFIIEALITPGPVWIGTALGIFAACGAWYLLPESINRVSIGACAVSVGFACGWFVDWASSKKK